MDTLPISFIGAGVIHFSVAGGKGVKVFVGGEKMGVGIGLEVVVGAEVRAGVGEEIPVIVDVSDVLTEDSDAHPIRMIATKQEKRKYLIDQYLQKQGSMFSTWHLWSALSGHRKKAKKSLLSMRLVQL